MCIGEIYENKPYDSFRNYNRYGYQVLMTLKSMKNKPSLNDSVNNHAHKVYLFDGKIFLLSSLHSALYETKHTSLTRGFVFQCLSMITISYS